MKGSQSPRSQDDPQPHPSPDIRSAIPRAPKPEALRIETTVTNDPPIERAAMPPPFVPDDQTSDASVRQAEPISHAGGKRRLFIVAACIALVLVAAGLRSYYSRRSSTPGRSALEFIQLGVDREGSLLRVHWDRNLPTLRDATRAVLHVQDGEIQTDRILTAYDLSTGSADYEPRNTELAFRLDVYSASPRATGQVQVMNLPAQSEIPAARATEARVMPPPQTSRTQQIAVTPLTHREPVVAGTIAKPEVTNETSRSVAKADDNTKPDVAIVIPPVAKAESKLPDTPDLPARRVSDTSSVSRVGPAIERTPVPDIPALAPKAAVSDGSPSVIVLAEPVSGSKLSHVVGKVPLLRRLQSHEGVAAPVPVYQAQPKLKLAPQQRVTAPLQVDVKVDVADSGNVSSAEIVEYGEPPNFSLANAALAAARQWTFKPARTEDLPVPSQVILHFRFEP
jgi:hypothetical protein